VTCTVPRSRYHSLYKAAFPSSCWPVRGTLPPCFLLTLLFALCPVLAVHAPPRYQRLHRRSSVVCICTVVFPMTAYIRPEAAKSLSHRNKIAFSLHHTRLGPQRTTQRSIQNGIVAQCRWHKTSRPIGTCPLARFGTFGTTARLG